MIDHDHGCIDAGAKALDLFPAHGAIFIAMVRLRMDLVLADLDEFARAAQHAWRGATDLHMRTRADRCQLELGVECCHLEDPDIGHIQHLGDLLNGRAGDPAILILCPHEQRNDS